MSEGSTPTLVARGRRAGLERPDPLGQEWER